MASLVVLGGAMELCGNDVVRRPRGAGECERAGKAGSPGSRDRA